MSTFNLVEACVRVGVDRLVNVSSETVAGMGFAERPFFAAAAPIDESLASRPQDPYALAKVFGEQLMDAAVARSDLRAISIRPTWVQWEGNYERSLAPWLTDPLGRRRQRQLLELRRRLRPRARAAAGGGELARRARGDVRRRGRQRRRAAAARS